MKKLITIIIAASLALTIQAQETLTVEGADSGDQQFDENGITWIITGGGGVAATGNNSDKSVEIFEGRGSLVWDAAIDINEFYLSAESFIGGEILTINFRDDGQNLIVSTQQEISAIEPDFQKVDAHLIMLINGQGYNPIPGVREIEFVLGAGITNIFLDDLQYNHPTPPTASTWTGNTSTDWNHAGNWDPTVVPSRIDVVSIPIYSGRR